MSLFPSSPPLRPPSSSRPHFSAADDDADPLSALALPSFRSVAPLATSFAEKFFAIGKAYICTSRLPVYNLLTSGQGSLIRRVWSSSSAMPPQDTKIPSAESYWSSAHFTISGSCPESHEVKCSVPRIYCLQKCNTVRLRTLFLRPPSPSPHSQKSTLHGDFLLHAETYENPQTHSSPTALFQKLILAVAGVCSSFRTALAVSSDSSKDSRVRLALPFSHQLISNSHLLETQHTLSILYSSMKNCKRCHEVSLAHPQAPSNNWSAKFWKKPSSWFIKK